MLGLLLLPATALAENHDTWGNRRWAGNSRYNSNYRNGARSSRSGPFGNLGGYPTNGAYGNPTYGGGRRWAYSDRDGDGDRDFRRHRHYRERGWYGGGHGHGDADDGYRGGWGNRGWGRGNNGWHNNGPWNGDTPPGWQHGRKRGWGNSDMPPGLAKKQGWW
jgi:hypothetical protein